MRALILCVALVALLVTEGCEGGTPRKPDIGGQTSSGLAPETLHLELFNPIPYCDREYRWDGTMLVWTRECLIACGRQLRPTAQAKISPPPDAWRRFWAELDSIDVWSWQRSYEQERFLTDRDLWKLEIRGRGKYVSSWGYDAFPPPLSDDPGCLPLFPLSPPNEYDIPFCVYDSPKFMRLLGAFEILFPPTGKIPGWWC